MPASVAAHLLEWSWYALIFCHSAPFIIRTILLSKNRKRQACFIDHYACCQFVSQSLFFSLSILICILLEWWMCGWAASVGRVPYGYKSNRRTQSFGQMCDVTRVRHKIYVWTFFFPHEQKKYRTSNYFIGIHTCANRWLVNILFLTLYRCLPAFVYCFLLYTNLLNIFHYVGSSNTHLNRKRLVSFFIGIVLGFFLILSIWHQLIITWTKYWLTYFVSVLIGIFPRWFF